MKVLLVIAALIAVSSCDIIKHIPCKGSYKPTAEIISVDVSGCEKYPCKLKRGEKTSLAITFKPTSDITSLKTIVKGKVGIWVPFSVDNDNACKDSGLTCPLKAGQEYTYKFSLFVKKAFPAIKVAVSWELRDQTNDDPVCFMFSTQLV